MAECDSRHVCKMMTNCMDKHPTQLNTDNNVGLMFDKRWLWSEYVFTVSLLAELSLHQSVSYDCDLSMFSL